MGRCVYEFRPMSIADLPLVRRWLATPEVTQWWGDTNEQFGLISGDPTNARAIRAYEKAGFRRDRLVETPDGRALLMLRNAGDAR
jgi:RimJ/RimL family protein N-acetyltransferase